MKCTNCGARIPRDAGTCPECGVFARVLKPSRPPRRIWPWIVLVVLVAVGVGVTQFVLMRPEAPKSRSKPVAARVDERQAILRLQQSFEKPECVAILSKGMHDGAYDFVAVNRCDGTKLGRWRVDQKTGAVHR